MGKLGRACSKFLEINSFIAGILMLVLMVFTTADVLLRFFKMPIPGSAEVTVSILACVIFLGIAWCAIQNAHIKVDVFKWLPWFDHITYCIVALLLLIASWATIGQAELAYQIKISSQVLNIPRWPFLLVTAYGFFLTAVATVMIEAKLIRERREKKAGKEERE